MPNALSKYAGGKQKLAMKIIQLMCPHNRFIEPFAGMMSVFLQKAKSKENVINDKNDSLVNLFMVARDNPEELIGLIRLTVYARSQYNNWWDLYFNHREEFYKLEPVKRALIYYALLEWSFNGQIPNCRELNNISFSSSGAWAGQRVINNIRDWSKFCQGAVFLNWDYEKVLEKFCNKDSLVYLDPPYVIAEAANYYEWNFGEKQHREMAEFVRHYHQTTGANFVISYDSVPWLQELYGGDPFVITTIKDVVYSMATATGGVGGTKDEILITTYDLETLGLFWKEKQ